MTDVFTLAEMRAALQACVEVAERDHLPREIVATARQGLGYLAALERRARAVAHQSGAPVLKLIANGDTTP